MFRSAFNVFRRNIWDVFAITGFITIGILFGILLTAPVINNEINISVNQIVAKATAVPYSGFDPAVFLKSVTEQLKNLDTRNPIRTITVLIEQNGFYRIFMGALTDANFNKEVLIEMKDTIIVCSDNLIKVLKEQLINFGICIIASSIIALVASRVIIQIRSTSNRSFGRFIVSFLLNLITVLTSYYLIILSFLNLDGIALALTIIGILMAMLILILLWSVICYKDKKTKFSKLFSFKNILLLWLSSLAVLSVAGIAFLVVYLINDVIAFVLLLPLVIVSNIINENIVINYVDESRDKNKTEKNVRFLNQL